MDRKKFMSKQKTWECTRGSQSSGALIVLLCKTQSRAVRVVVPPTLVQGRTLPLLSPCATILLWCQRCPGAEGWLWGWWWWQCCKPRPCHSKLRKSQAGGKYVQAGNQLNRLAHLQCVPAAAGSWTRGHPCLFISFKYAGLHIGGLHNTEFFFQIEGAPSLTFLCNAWQENTQTLTANEQDPFGNVRGDNKP